MNETILEDDDIVVMLPQSAITKGQLSIVPKKKFTILEEVPDGIIGKMFQVANKLSSVLFDTLGCQGTNILIQNGVSAGQINDIFSLSVVPRYEGDSVSLEWQPKASSEENLNKVQGMFKSSATSEQQSRMLNEQKIKAETKREPERIAKKKDDDENYLVKSLDRIP